MTEFNARAAKAAEILIKNMDPDAAAMFVELVTADVVEETIEKNIVPLQRHLDHVVSKRLEQVAKATHAVVTRTGEGHEYAAALVAIKKDWIEREHPRAADGRFKTKIHSSYTPGQKPVDARSAETIGIKSPHGKQGYKGMSEEQAVRYQQQYTQLANFLRNVQEATGGDADILLHYREKGGAEYTTKVSGTNPDPKLLKPNEDTDLVGVEARPNALNIGGAAFGLSTALGADASSVGVGHGAATLNALDGPKGFTSFADSWTAEADPKSSNARTYQRVQAGSQLLGTVGAATGNQNALIAAQFGQFVGSHGPEAEKVFGPTMRKTAYRYRGVTREPDAQLVSVYNRTVSQAKLETANDPYRNAQGKAKANLKRPATLEPVQMAAARVAAERREPTWEERQNGRRVVQAYLENRLPKGGGLYNLQLASGNTPPSEGVIIDAHGQLVSQSVGYGDDHYLPFNLKHLKRLRGGEYIRTRSVGGPTTEDIYTGLMAGAKQITVVSRSGTFVVKFDDTFKGGRRYNDKALRMSKRYAQLLDAVQSQQVDAQSVEGPIRQAIAAKAREDYAGYKLPNKEMNRIIEERVEEFKSSPEFGQEDEELATYMSRIMQIRADRGEISQRDADDFKNSVRQELAAQKEFKYRLNANGYKAALDALQEQFPYYIEKPTFIPRKENEARALPPELDRGYVEPGRNRPTAASAGLFGAKVQQPYKVGGKFSAAEADYQGVRSPSPTLNTPEKGLKPTGEKLDTTEFREKMEQGRHEQSFIAAAQKLQEHAKTVGLRDPQGNPLNPEELSYTAEDLKDPVKQKRFDTWARQFIEASRGSSPVPMDIKAAYLKATMQVGQEKYEPSKRAFFGDKPYTGFAKSPHRLVTLDARYPSSLTHADRRLSELTDAQLKDDFNAAITLKDYFTRMESAGIATADERLQTLQGEMPKTPTLGKLAQDPSKIDDFLDAIHEVRAINAGKSDEERLKPITVQPAPEGSDLGPVPGAKKLVEEFRKAAAIYEKNGADFKGDQLRLAASAIEDGIKDNSIRSKSDVERLTQDQFAAEVKLAQEAFAHQRFRQQVDTVGNANILNYDDNA